MEKLKSWLTPILLGVLITVTLVNPRPRLPTGSIVAPTGFSGLPVSGDSVWVVSQSQAEDGTLLLTLERHLFSSPDTVSQTIVVHGPK